MSIYLSHYPDIPFDPLYKAFFQEFYKVVDTPDAHERYVQFFTKDATLIMASKRGDGSEEILNMRKAMWTAVSERIHSPHKVFPFGPDSNEVMLFGTVDYKMKNGDNVSKEWAARATLVKEDEQVRMSFYQVYLDTAPPAK